MRRPRRVEAREGRAGCIGSLLGAVGGLVLSFLVFQQTGQAWPFIMLVLFGAYLGARVSQWLASRKRGIRRHRG